MLKKLNLILLFISISLTGIFAQPSPYKNPKLSPDVRAKDLLTKMTIDEKIAQLQCMWSKKPYVTIGKFNEANAAKVFKYGLGQIARINEPLPDSIAGKYLIQHPKDGATLYNAVQKYFIEKTRLGIPVMVHEEGLHGQQSQDATNFPTPMALASSWNENLISEVFANVAEEIRARGGHQVLAPVVDVVRDPRWGRTDETFGEDPYLISRLAIAEIKALQGTGEYLKPNKVAATLKHFGVHGQSEGGVNVAPSNIDKRTSYEVFFAPFKACIKQAAVMNIMPCYNELFGIPVHANKSLLTDLVRNKWGFRGLFVSDYSGVANLNNLHFVAPTMADAGVMAFNAGIDIETPDAEGFTHLKSALSQNKITMAQLNEHVLRVLVTKFRLGLFENPYVDAQKTNEIVATSQKRAIAYKAATEGMVLLKNNNNFLPLDKSKVNTIAFIGPNADKCILGAYSDKAKFNISPLQAIKEKYGNDIKILYAEGVKITDKNDWFADTIRLADPVANQQKILEAVEVAKQADVVVLFVGGNESTNREGWLESHLGDLPTLELLSNQNDLIKAIVNTGKPTCAFVNSGPPMDISYLNSAVPAIMQCWFLGQEGGYAMVDALFGTINPSGKLPITFARSTGHIPAYYNYKPSARRGYNLGFEVSPLYTFGHGLSYTSFRYSNLRISAPAMKKNSTVTVSVDVKNTGNRSGAETVQMYIRDMFSSVTRPVKELKGFKKVHLAAGETKTVSFTITPELLSFYDVNMNWIIEPGDFKIMVGTASDNNTTINLKVLN